MTQNGPGTFAGSLNVTLSTCQWHLDFVYPGDKVVFSHSRQDHFDDAQPLLTLLHKGRITLTLCSFEHCLNSMKYLEALHSIRTPVILSHTLNARGHLRQLTSIGRLKTVFVLCGVLDRLMFKFKSNAASLRETISKHEPRKSKTLAQSLSLPTNTNREDI